MTKTQEMKMQLLKEFGITDDLKTIDFCREAYKFLMEGDMMKLVGYDENGAPIIERTTATVSEASASNKASAVDLGLPSGTLWADRNVGAKSPEDYGALFSYGNTEPIYPVNNRKDWGDNNDAFAEERAFSEGNYRNTEGYKLKGDIDLSHDAARINMGEPWQMPTSKQFQELYDNCDWTRKIVNGVNGYLVTSKVNGNSIFFPCSGNGNGSSWSSRGTYGYYWSSSLHSATHGRVLLFGAGGVYAQFNNYRFYGLAVRPVQTSFNQTK